MVARTRAMGTQMGTFAPGMTGPSSLGIPIAWRHRPHVATSLGLRRDHDEVRPLKGLDRRHPLESVAGGETITLLCSSACTDAQRCHRTLFTGLIEQRLAQRS
jgi:hypothetical protein